MSGMELALTAVMALAAVAQVVLMYLDRRDRTKID